jgi:hypothetical protein
MSPATIFQIHLILGYVPWLLCFGAYVWPRLRAMDRIEAQRAIATLHSFRFFGLVFIISGAAPICPPASPHSPPTVTSQPDCWPCWRFSRCGYVRSFGRWLSPSILWEQSTSSSTIIDIIVDYYHGNQVGLPALAGELGATYAIPIIYVPLLMITHVAAFYLLLRHRTQAARTLPGGAAAVDGISG